MKDGLYVGWIDADGPDVVYRVRNGAVHRVEVDSRGRVRFYRWHLPNYGAIGGGILDLDTPEAIHAYFPTASSRCLFCGRKLTDDTSVLVGIGPDCRRGIGFAAAPT